MSIKSLHESIKRNVDRARGHTSMPVLEHQIERYFVLDHQIEKKFHHRIKLESIELL